MVSHHRRLNPPLLITSRLSLQYRSHRRYLHTKKRFFFVYVFFIAVSEEQATHAENSNLILHGLAKDNQAKLRLEAFKIAKETGTDYEAVLEMVGISKESTVPVLKPVAPRPARPDLKSAFNDAFDAASSDGHDPDD
mmetsp:Transcript_22509/g.37745  ORF Transcript_22509/g.37745 Transcript_22509/m.37745 type:complete len:137 (+) Transcript_22509:531-941(+)